MAEQKQLPAFVARVNKRFFTPDLAIIGTAAIMLVLTLKQSFVQALTISAIARLVTYGVTCAALPVLRRRRDVPAALFRLPGGTIVAVLSLILAAWLLANSTLYEALIALAAAAVGLVVYVVYKLSR
jgi:amino acid transporter